MKKQILRKNFFAFLIAIAFCGVEKVNAQWVLIPDSNFRNAIAAHVPSAISGDSLDTTNVQIINMTFLDVSDDSIYDLA